MEHVLSQRQESRHRLQHILNRWIRYVEATGHEVGITLLVGGATITGYLTPMLRYDEWLKEVMHRAIHEGGRSELPLIPMEPISAQLTQRVQEEWGERELVPEGGDIDDPVIERGPGCVIRNAEVRPSGPKMYWQTYPYLQVQVSAVQAISLVSNSGPSLG